MKKMLFFIMLCTFVFSAWSDYKEASWQKLATYISNVHEENKDQPGQSYWFEKYSIYWKLSSYPKPSNDEYLRRSIANYIKVMGIGDNKKDYYQSLYFVRQNILGKKIIFVFQDTLPAFMKKEVKIGDNIQLYIYFGAYNSFEDETIVLVNEFETEQTLRTKPMFKEADSYMGEKKYTEAIAVYDEIIKLYPNAMNAFYNKGLCLMYLEKYQEAQNAFDKVLKIHPKDAGAYYNKGQCYRDIGDFNMAISCFNKVIELDNSSADPYYQLAICYFNKKAYDKAINSYNKTIELAPKDEGMLQFAIACCEVQQGNKKAAITSLQKAVKAGYVSKERFINSEYLKPLQDQKEFKEIVQNL